MALLMAATVPAIWLMSYATAYWHFLVIGLFVGLAGGSFSVGTPYVARWFPKRRQGMAMGVYGAGNSGAAVNKFVAPVLLVAFGWTMVPQVYAAIMLGTVILFWLFSTATPSTWCPEREVQRPAQDAEGPQGAQVLPVLQHRVRRLRGAGAVDGAVLRGRVRPGHPCGRPAGRLLLLPGGVLRAVGGWLSDKYGAHSVTWWVLWVSWICLFLLSYPQTDFTVQTVNGPTTFHIGLNVYCSPR
jgi:NNP family nitrate/nitrite transporter-like MFS transporter